MTGGRWRDHLAAIPWRPLLAAGPVVLVNAVAFAGQLAFLRAHLPWGPAGQILVAVALEAIAIYLAWQAHLAQLANDSALRLRLAAYGFAALIAVMNYSHYAAPGWRPTLTAVVVAMCSAVSPWLWSVHTRRISRDALMRQGLVEPHALRLGSTRWMWHPYRSVRVMWAATWDGTTEPRRAIHAVYPQRWPDQEPQTVLSKVPSSVLEAAKASMAATYAAGNPLSANALAERFSLTRAQATEVRDGVLSPPVLPDPGHTLNGHGPRG